MFGVLLAVGSRAAEPLKDPVASLQLAPGLQASLWAAEPLVENAVAISFDDRGRCYLAETHRWSQSVFDITKQPNWLEEDLSFRSVGDRSNFLARTFATNLTFLTKDAERVRFVEDLTGEGRAQAGGTLAGGFNVPTGGTAAGVLAWEGAVWFANIPDLWKLQSTSASGEADVRQVMHSGFGVHIGVSGHDLHGLEMGPDGRLYFSIGDRGFSVTPPPGTRTDTNSGWHFGFHQPDTGAVLRCDPDGSNLEVFAIGLRNPQELTFDAEGNLWTGDNDTAGADESRLIHVVEGGDYGWRCGYQHQPGFGPWVKEGVWRGELDDTLPTSGVVAQGPSGLDFYPGTGLGKAWENHFLMCDFPGGVWDFTVRPQGASFLLDSKRKFVWNLWPPDVEFGPDGAVYVADWVFGWDKPSKGRIYRITPTGASDPRAAETRQLLREGFAQRPPSELGALLNHPDRRIRLRAQFALVKSGDAGLDQLAQSARQPRDRTARLHAIWGLGQAARRSAAAGSPSPSNLFEALLRLTADPDLEVRSQAVKQLGELRHPPAAGRIVQALADPSPRVRLFAGIALGRLGRNPTIAPVLDLLRQNAGADRFLVHAGVMALLGMADDASLVRLHRDPSAAVRQAAVLALRRRGHPDLTLFLNDTDSDIAYLAARAIHDLPIEAGLPELATYLGKVDSPTNLLSRAINANFRLGDARNATVLANFANRGDVPEEFRLSALEALAGWSPASPIDRIVGLWRPIPNRSAEPAKRAVRAVAASLHRSRSDAVKIAAMKAIGELGIKEAGHGLFESLQTNQVSVAVRSEILRTLAKLKHSRWSEASQLGLADAAAPVRLEALRLTADSPTDAAVALLPSFLSATNELRVRQTALRILGQLENPQATRLLSERLEQLVTGQLEPELMLDVLNAARRSAKPPLATLIDRYEKGRTPEGPAGSFLPLLRGGDGARGKNLFVDRADVSCLRCHRVNGVGGTVGPNLDGLGQKLSREEILKSIVRPNDRIAAGYEQAQLVLKDGTPFAGTLREETETELLVENLEDGSKRIRKTDIKERRRGLSPMPEGLDKVLTPDDLRDLVEYLAGLR